MHLIRKEHVEFKDYLLIFSVSIFFRCTVVINNIPLATISDEMSMISPAAFLCGYDWSDTVSTVGYYGIGIAWIFAPLFAFHLNTVLIYRIVSIFCCVIMGFTTCCYYAVINKYYLTNKRIHKFAAAGIVDCTQIASVYSIGISINEVMLLFIGALIIYHLFAILNNENKRKHECFLNIVIIYGYTIHTRAITYTIALLFVYVLLLFFFKKNRRFLSISFFLINFIGYFGINIFLKYYQATIWYSTARNASLYSKLKNSTMNNFILIRFKSIAMIIISTIVNHYSLTLGLSLLAVLIIINSIFFIAIRHLYDFRPEHYVGMLFLFAYLITIVGMSYMWSKGVAEGIANGFYNTEFRAFYYPRYSGTYVPPLILASLLIINNESTILRKSIIQSSVLIIIMSFCYFYIVVPYIETNKVGFFIMQAINTNRNSDMEIWKASIQFIIAVALIWIFIVSFKSLSSFLFFCFLTIYFYANIIFVFYFINITKAKQENAFRMADAGYKILNECHSDFLNEDIYVYDVRDVTNHFLWCEYQFLNYDLKVVHRLPTQKESNAIVFTNGMLDSVFLQDYTCIRMDENEYIYYCGDKYSNILEKIDYEKYSY